MDRRTFIASALALPRFASDIPKAAHYVVIVCGGGPAGFAAACSAAAAGIHSAIFESSSCLGGTWTRGLLSWVFDFKKDGICAEIVSRLDRRNARHGGNNRDFVYEPEAMKLVLEEIALESKVDVHYFTRCCGARTKDGKMAAIITDSKSGIQMWTAKIFIDCTGDGDVCAQAGASFDFGTNGDRVVQPCSFNAIVSVKDVEKLADRISAYKKDSLEGHVDSVRLNLKDLLSYGIDPSYHMPTLFHLGGNILLMMFNQQYNVHCDNAAELTAATIQARREVFKIVDVLSKTDSPWNGMKIISTCDHIGIREGRRVKGLYTVSKDDVVNGARHPDAVTRATFCVDIHAPTKEENKEKTIKNIHTKPYDIPLRALICRDIDNLMMAGRCISGDRIAHASYRVTGNAADMGYKAGLAAADFIARGVTPHSLKNS